MFSGNLRENVDPLRLYSDDAVKDALLQAGLGSKKLDDEVGVSGAGWSVGEKQLVSDNRISLQTSSRCICPNITILLSLNAVAST